MKGKKINNNNKEKRNNDNFYIKPTLVLLKENLFQHFINEPDESVQYINNINNTLYGKNQCTSWM